MDRSEAVIGIGTIFQNTHDNTPSYLDDLAGAACHNIYTYRWREHTKVVYSDV